MASHISQSTLDFLKAIKSNNNREWFMENKKWYEQEMDTLGSFADALIVKMKQHDDIENASGKKSIFRIYRDVRFSKDKTPYKTNLGGYLKRATKFLRGGYYFHIEPGNCFVGGGFWGPNSDDLKQIREHIAFDPEPLQKILSSKEFKSIFGTLRGEQLKTAPKGYPKDHPAIDLLRYKQFLISKKFTDNQVTNTNYMNEVENTFRAMRPFFDYMSEILTTNLNGEVIV